MPKSLEAMQEILDALGRHMINILEKTYPEASNDYMIRSLRQDRAEYRGIRADDKALDNDAELIKVIKDIGLPRTTLSPSAQHTSMVMDKTALLISAAYDMQLTREGEGTLVITRRLDGPALGYHAALATATHAIESDPELMEGMKVIAAIHDLATKSNLNALEERLYMPGKAPAEGYPTLPIHNTVEVQLKGLSAAERAEKLEPGFYYDNEAARCMAIARVDKVYEHLKQR